MRNSKGFTLLEVTVVLVVISLLSIIFIANYREGEKQFALKRSAHQLAQSLRKAQGMALSSQEFMGAYQGGYGIYFSETPGGEETGVYTLFVDCDNDNKFDGDDLVCDDCRGGSCTASSSERIEDFSLETRIKIDNLTPSSIGNTLCITFTPPEPTVVFDPDGASVSITLNFEGGSGKTVFVNKACLIEIE